LALFSRRGLETHKRPLLAFAAPFPHRRFHLRVAARIAAFLQLPEQTAGIGDALSPALAQVGTVGVDLPLSRRALIGLRWDGKF
jgi:hypothetical protein